MAGGCSSSCPAGVPCPAIGPRVTFTATINGKSAAPGKNGHGPSYRARPGEYLVMRVVVTVPKQVVVTSLWFGISTGPEGFGPNRRPVGMNPVLAHYRQPLSAGSHTFGLRWRISHRRSGASLYLGYAWSSSQADVAGAIAQLILN